MNIEMQILFDERIENINSRYVQVGKQVHALYEETYNCMPSQDIVNRLCAIEDALILIDGRPIPEQMAIFKLYIMRRAKLSEQLRQR